MNKVVAGISMSLDGFVTGPNRTRDQQLGDGGDLLHQWLHDPDRHDTEPGSSFEFRATAPLFVSMPFALVGAPADGWVVHLQATRNDGAVAMTARYG